MRNRLSGCVGLLLSCLLSSCMGSNGSHKWVQYNSGEGAFSVLFPGSPKATEKIEPTAFGKQKVHYLRWKPSSLDIYKIKLVEVAFTNCPPSLSSDSIMLGIMLDSSIRMRQKDFTDKDVPIQNIELNGYPGRAFIYDVPKDNSTLIVKQCIVNGRRYELQIVASGNQSTNSEVADFFNSFTALK